MESKDKIVVTPSVVSLFDLVVLMQIRNNPGIHQNLLNKRVAALYDNPKSRRAIEVMKRLIRYGLVRKGPKFALQEGTRNYAIPLFLTDPAAKWLNEQLSRALDADVEMF